MKGLFIGLNFGSGVTECVFVGTWLATHGLSPEPFNWHILFSFLVGLFNFGYVGFALYRPKS